MNSITRKILIISYVMLLSNYAFCQSEPQKDCIPDYYYNIRDVTMGGFIKNNEMNTYIRFRVLTIVSESFYSLFIEIFDMGNAENKKPKIIQSYELIPKDFDLTNINEIKFESWKSPNILMLSINKDINYEINLALEKCEISIKISN